MDDQVAVPTDQELADLLEQFVCVRLVQMWGVDLNRFQFDFAMTWSAFFTNSDGTIYGRYGTRTGGREGAMRDISLAGFKAALVGALDLHRRYSDAPQNTQPELAGKQPQYKVAWKRAQDIPMLKKRKLAIPFRGRPNTHTSCIHCHHIPNHEMWSMYDRKKAIPDHKIWPFPMPDAIGMHMNPKQRATVTRVLDGTPAAMAGVQSGDEIVRFGGQAILSTADLQWVLHNAKNPDQLSLDIERAGQTQSLSIQLEEGWRDQIVDWRFFNLQLMNWAAGFNGRAVPAEQARRLGFGPGELAFRVRRADKKKVKADLKPDDLVIEVDGKRDHMTLGMFTAYVTQQKKPGSYLRLVRRRAGKDRAIKVRMQ